MNPPSESGKTNPIKPNFHGGLNERELFCRKRVMEMILKTAKFGISMMLGLANQPITDDVIKRYLEKHSFLYNEPTFWDT